MKIKIITISALILMMLSTFSIADDLEIEEVNVDEIKGEVLETASSVSDVPSINSKAAIVIDRESKCILYSKNANERRAMASTTKIMTAIIALENCSMEKEIVVSKKAASIGGSRLGLRARG